MNASNTSYSKQTPETIAEMFGTIAPRYDRANAILSLGMHKGWNGALRESVGIVSTLLDLCAGTGEIGLGALRAGLAERAILLDFCPEMLEVAKKRGNGLAHRFETMVGDAQKLPLEDASVDGATVAYGVRNIKEPKRCFDEVFRVLKKGGKFGILELTRPKSAFMRLGHRFYLRSLLPILGKWVAHNEQAYRYLSSSIDSFVAPDALVGSLRQSGFVNVKSRPLTGGVATLITGEKPCHD